MVGHLKVGEGAAGGREGQCDLGDRLDKDIGASGACRNSMDLLLLRAMSTCINKDDFQVMEKEEKLPRWTE